MAVLPIAPVCNVEATDAEGRVENVPETYPATMDCVSIQRSQTAVPLALPLDAIFRVARTVFARMTAFAVKCSGMEIAWTSAKIPVPGIANARA